MRYETKVEPRTLDDDVDSAVVYDAYCHDTALDEPCFRSVGWSSEETATERIAEHTAEHANKVPMRELEAYRQGVTTEEYEALVEQWSEQNALPAPTVEVEVNDAGGEA